MTTRWRQKASSALAVAGVIALLLLLIFLWTAVRNGVFSERSHSDAIVNNRFEMKGSVGVAGRTGRPAQTPQLGAAAAAAASASAYLADDEDGDSNGDGTAKPQLTFVTTTTTTTKSPVEMRDHLAGQSKEEFVRPSKQPPRPMHDLDMLMEMQMKDVAGDTSPIVIKDNATGNYRKASNRVWDAYPEYLISAFGLHLDLQLRQNNEFISKDLKISHVTQIGENATHIQHEPYETVVQLPGCFYTGHVRGDEQSKVSVSLCDGMRGHIYTSFGSFFIEPVEPYTADNPLVLHRINRLITHLPKATASSNSSTSNANDGDTRTSNVTSHIVASSSDDNAIMTSAASSPTAPPVIRRRKRDIMSPNVAPQQQHHYHQHVQPTNAYTMKVLVGVDTKMQDYHRENGRNLKEYILTLMSIVSSVYSDPSIGNAINIAVVDIVHTGTLVTPPHPSSNQGISAPTMLARFCQYVQRNTRRQHDVALLLTREQICRNNSENVTCDTLGLAELGTMCRPSSCAIVQENGLGAAFTIAHELGHVLSIPHDDDEKCKRYTQQGDQLKIMSRMLDDHVHPWSWSQCSRHHVTEFLENNQGLCMLNAPERDIAESTGAHEYKLAGEKYTADDQCRLIHGPESTVCSYMSVCEQLWCGNDEIGCLSLRMPWADGTPCRNDDPSEHWCQRRECVRRNPHALVKVDGGWGPWSRYTECSRTCGGGVTSIKRDCNNPTPSNGGKYCIGPRIRYESCNTEPCPSSDMDFRDKQCASFNGNSLDIEGIPSNVRWVPKYVAYPTDECKLFCRVTNSNHYYPLSEKVIDGTACTQDTFNKCVNGVCRPAACDNQMFSKSQLDKCGVCNGNNDSCIDVTDVLHQSQLVQLKRRPTRSPFYHDVCRIPAGSSNIDIVQMGHLDDLNYIALLDENGTYILNGNNIILQYSKTFVYGSVTFAYTGTNSTTERVNSSYTRKLTRELRVQIMSRTDHYPYDEMMSCTYTKPLPDPNVRRNQFYEYNNAAAPEPVARRAPSSSPRALAQHSAATAAPQQQHHHHPYHPPTAPTTTTTTTSTTTTTTPAVPTVMFRWAMSAWGKCNSICNGTRGRAVECVQSSDMDRDRIVPDAYCSLPMPVKLEPCNAHCSFYWRTVDCPADCEQARAAHPLRCILETNGDGGKVKDNIYCTDVPKPSGDQTRCSGPCIAYGEWSECCRGQQHQQRRAYCKSNPINGYPLSDQYCVGMPRDGAVRQCDVHDCPAQWEVDTTAPCSVTCGDGYRLRPYQCVRDNRSLYAEHCAHLPRPESPLVCSMPACRPAPPMPSVVGTNRWLRRNYFDYAAPTTSTTSMPTTTTPTTTTTSTTTTTPAPTTTMQAPPSFSWRSSMWTGCSVTCGPNGIRQRHIRCHSDRTDEPIDDRYCRPDHRPLNVTTCDRQSPCAEWSVGPWRECSEECAHQRSVRCLSGSQPVDEAHCRVSDPYAPAPIGHESCCSFKWRTRWTPCSTSCGEGVRTRQLICTRVQPLASAPSSTAARHIFSVQQPGSTQHVQRTIVDNARCAHLKPPLLQKRQKRCSKPCITPQWRISAWSRCTVGCGKGYTNRQVKCMYGKHVVTDSQCSATPKPIKFRPCDSKRDCLWKPDPWRNCSCSGTTKRRIQCYDIGLRKPSSNCVDAQKPLSRQQCTPPPNCSCRTLQQRKNVRTNGEYVLNVRGKPVRIYCHDMNTVQPKEYITLQQNLNYAMYYDRRALDRRQCPRSERDMYADDSLPSGTTHFQKVRLDLHGLRVVEDDYQFARVSGARQQPFGSAGDCLSEVTGCVQGRFVISFVGTRFRMRSDTRWEVSTNATMAFSERLQTPYKMVSASCGGFCGSCFINKDTGLQLEVEL